MVKLLPSFSTGARLAAGLLLGLSVCVGMGSSASADTPSPEISEAFKPDHCAGHTVENPESNADGPVGDLLNVFDQRLKSYNAGNVVPLYDAFGGSILLDTEGNVTPGAYEAYPPLCGTRYVKSEGGPVSEWMFCTDRHAPSCGDVDAEGNLIGPAGAVLNPMTALERNPRLTPEQEKVIAYLVQFGHAYDGTGDQAWGNVEEARSDLDSNERAALQTLIWCVSDPDPDVDPVDGPTDFQSACEDNMDAAEQARILALMPDVPQMVLKFDASGQTLRLGDTAKFSLITNVYNQPISLVTGGTANPTFTVCEGDATISGTTLTVAGDDPEVSTKVVLCATGSVEGTVTVDVSASPPSTRHIGWSQSKDNATLEKACQVYATFHEVQLTAVQADAEATFAAKGTPDTDEPDTDEPTTDKPAKDAPDTSDLNADQNLPNGGSPVGLWQLLSAVAAISLGTIFTVTARRKKA